MIETLQGELQKSVGKVGDRIISRVDGGLKFKDAIEFLFEACRGICGGRITKGKEYITSMTDKHGATVEQLVEAPTDLIIHVLVHHSRPASSGLQQLAIRLFLGSGESNHQDRRVALHLLSSPVYQVTRFFGGTIIPRQHLKEISL